MTTMSSMSNLAAYGAAPARLRPPSKWLMLSEWRAIFEIGLLAATAPALLAAKPGDGHPVLVLPGFLAGDETTDLMRGYLKVLGYQTHGWELGRNLGGVYSMRKRLRARLAAVHAKSGQKVSVVGWSLGGVYARDLTLSMPEHVRSCITMGSPFAGDLTATNAGRLYELLSGESVARIVPGDLERLRGALPVPSTSFFTKTDGVVNWRTCITDESPVAENIEVLASHIGLGVNPAVLWALADRLAQPEGTFAPFDRGGPFMLAYPR